MQRLTTEEFIERAKKIFGDKYDYSKAIYKNSAEKVVIICPQHGEFSTIPNNFLKGHACPACAGRQRITSSIFVERAQIKHLNRYDYSKVDYTRLDTPVCIICPIHGEFWQKPLNHLNGCGCQRCFATPKSSTSEFIEKAQELYGDKYDYSKVKYSNNKTKVCIICPTHGEWWVTPNNFLRGSLCPGCYGTFKHTNKEFISKARIIHGNKYDYSKVIYDGLKKVVEIICPIHGVFLQSPSSHLKGSGCPKCNHRVHLSLETFIEKSTNNHTIKYDYSKVQIKRGSEKVCIICPTHGEFWQTASYHANGGNCPHCVGGTRLSKESFIEKANIVHNNKYDYSKIEYTNYSTKVCIICTTHGEFWQTPNNHLFGAGCPICPQSNLESELRQFLIRKGILFEQEVGFDWLRYKRKLYLDFYLPEFKIAIECQGGQHFFPVELFGGESFFTQTLQRDKIKYDLCKKNGIKVLYFSNSNIDYPYPVIENYNDLLIAIEQQKKI